MFRSLRAKLIAATLLVQLLMVAGLTWNSQRLIESRLLTQFERRVAVITPMVSAALITPLFQRDFAAAREALTTMRQEDFSYLILLDSTGKMVAAEDWPLDRAPPPPSPRLTSEMAQSLQVFDLRIPIQYAGQPYGELAAGLNLGFLRQILDEHLRQTLGIAVLGIFFSTLLMVAVSLWLTRHLRLLTLANQSLAAGKPLPPIAIPSSDEIGALARSFSDMASSLQTRMAEIEAAKKSLGDLAAEQRAMLNNGIVGIVKMRDRRFIWANPAFEQALGYASGELNGQSNRMIYPDDASHAAMAVSQEVLARGEIWRSQVQYVRKDGTLRWFELSGGALPDGASLWSLVDITGLKQALGDAEAANRSKNQFLGNISHELRTPVHGVLGMAQLLLMSSPSEEQRDYAQEIVRSGKLLQGLIDDLLDISKIETGKLELRLVEFDPAAMLSDALTPLARRAEASGLRFIGEIDPKLPHKLLGDAVRLEQVLVILVGNAIKFTEQGEVAVRIASEALPGEKVRLNVQVGDSGMGIPPEKLAQLFAPFGQVDGSITRRHGGAGLGLAIARQLVGLMGGDIRVESQPGKGSIFRFAVECAVAMAVPGAVSTGANRFDADAARRNLGDDEELFRCVLTDLCGDVSQRLAELQAAVERGDTVVARREAHTLKGLAATGGNNVLRQAALEIQELCDKQDLASAAQRLPALEGMLGEAIAAWQDYLRR